MCLLLNREGVCGHKIMTSSRPSILLYKEEDDEEERRRRMPNRNFTSRGAYVKLRYIAMLYTHSIENQP